MASSYKRIASVAKACDILGILAEAKQPLTGNEVAARAGQPDGTVMCMLATLGDAGFVQEVGGGWRLGMKLALFWARVKSGKEAERERIDQDIAALEG
ncbi:MAG: helix-turn-helix domain-containing protein [Desulfuromonadaceae bacterium]